MPLSQSPPKTPSTGSGDKFLQRANEFKEAGNIELRKGRMLKGHTASKHSVTEACVHYARGLEQIEMAKKEGNIGDGDIRAAVLPLYLNLSVANLMLEEWEPAEACCDAILQGGGGVDRVNEVFALTLSKRNQEGGDSTTFLDHTDTSVITACKALYRRAQAKAGGGHLDEALADLRRALMLCPRDGQVRRVYSEVKEAKKKKQAREDLERETELGKTRQHLHNEKGNQEKKQERATAPTEATIQRDEEETCAMMKNGGVGGNGAFMWSQTISNLCLTFTLPQAIRSSNVKVILHRQSVNVSYSINNTRQEQQQAASSADGREVIEAINGRLPRPICVDESTWMLEEDGHLLVINLCKDLSSDGPNGFEWWSRILEDDEDIDMGHVNAGMDLRDYPEHVHQKICRALWQQSSTACQDNDDDHTSGPEAEADGQQEQPSREEDLKRQFAKEQQEENELQKAKVLNDPNMAYLFNSLKEKFPDTDILYNKPQ